MVWSCLLQILSSEQTQTHTRVGGRYSDHWTHISIFAIPDEALVSAIESILIAAVPARNGSKPRVKRIPLPAAYRKWQRQKALA